MHEIFKPRVMLWFHGILTVVWGLMMPIAIYFNLLVLIAFVSVLSIYALFIGHFSSWQAVRVELKQDIADDKKDDSFEVRLEEKIDKLLENRPT